jgi:hypothetical protein
MDFGASTAPFIKTVQKIQSCTVWSEIALDKWKIGRLPK